MSGKKDKFEEVADYGDKKIYLRDFGFAVIDDDGEEKEIPLVLVADIMDYYEATGDDKFEENPFGISISIFPRMDFIDKVHIASCADSAGIEPEEVTYADFIGFSSGVPIVMMDLEDGFKDMDEAEEFLLSDDFRKKLNAKSAMIGFYLDGAINKIGYTRWSMIEYLVDSKKDFYRQ